MQDVPFANRIIFTGDFNLPLAMVSAQGDRGPALPAVQARAKRKVLQPGEEPSFRIPVLVHKNPADIWVLLAIGAQ